MNLDSALFEPVGKPVARLRNGDIRAAEMLRHRVTVPAWNGEDTTPSPPPGRHRDTRSKR